MVVAGLAAPPPCTGSQPQCTHARRSLYTYRVDDQIVTRLVGADDELCDDVQALVGVFHKVIEGPDLQGRGAREGGREGGGRVDVQTWISVFHEVIEGPDLRGPTCGDEGQRREGGGGARDDVKTLVGVFNEVVEGPDLQAPGKAGVSPVRDGGERGMRVGII